MGNLCLQRGQLDAHRAADGDGASGGADQAFGRMAGKIQEQFEGLKETDRLRRELISAPQGKARDRGLSP